MPVSLSGGEVTSLSLVGAGEIPRHKGISTTTVQVKNTVFTMGRVCVYVRVCVCVCACVCVWVCVWVAGLMITSGQQTFSGNNCHLSVYFSHSRTFCQ